MTENQLEVYKKLLQNNIDNLQELYKETKDERLYGQIKGYEMALKDLNYILGIDWLK